MTATELLSVTIADVLAGNPAAARVLVSRGMAACIGCAFSPFDTVADAACVYGIEPMALATALIEESAHDHH